MFVVKGSLRTGQTRESAEGQEHLASEPEWIDGRFVCMLGCHHCKGEIALAGKYRYQEDRDPSEIEREGDPYVSYFTPLFFSEAPHVIRIPEAAPNEVREKLADSFRLYWHDPESAANRVRSALELLLTAQGVNRTVSGKRGKRLTLHERVKRYESKRSDIAGHLLAVKWLGNAGSHPSPISHDDVLDGYEIMEHVLDELYVGRARRVGALSRAINRRKGPRPKAKRAS